MVPNGIVIERTVGEEPKTLIREAWSSIGWLGPGEGSSVPSHDIEQPKLTL